MTYVLSWSPLYAISDSFFTIDICHVRVILFITGKGMLFKAIIRGLLLLILTMGLPIGLEQDDSDSPDMQFGIHGGGGRVASVITGCSGAEEAVKNDFLDVSGEVYLRLPQGSNSDMVIGLRGGYWRTDLDLIDYGYFEHIPDYSYSYLNPCVSLETRNIGMGFGIIIGDVPVRFENGAIHEAGPITGHLRIGSVRGVNVSLSFMESTPQVSGGGLYDLSVSVPLSNRFRASYGLGFAPYYHVGFVQRNRISISRHFALDFNWRFGETEGVAEYGISAGLIYRLGFGNQD